MIRNLTPHAVNVLISDRQMELASNARPARLRQNAVAAGRVDLDGVGIELFDISINGLQDLPAPEPGVWLLVPHVVAEACPERRDLVFPYREVRDGTGRVIGCTALGRPAQEGC